MKILSVPIPVLIGAVVVQVPEYLNSAPGWVVAFLVGAYVIVWLLNQFGLIPKKFRNGNKIVHFTEEDRERLERIGEIIIRDDPNEPGWPILWSHWRECRDCKAVLASMNNLLEDHHRVNTATLETLAMLKSFLTEQRGK